jgi:hypothetical protein
MADFIEFLLVKLFQVYSWLHRKLDTFDLYIWVKIFNQGIHV